jgi:2'-5' RNA ligase
MYIWTGIDVDSQLSDIKSQVKLVEESIGFNNSNFTLPFHISLKISFEVDNTIYSDVVNTIVEYYKTLKPFDIEVSGIEIENVIVWLRMEESEITNKIHDDLDRILMEKYGVPRHEYDLDYKFHTTLFMDSDEEKIFSAYHKIKGMEIPLSLHADRFLIGASATGALGTYKVAHNIKI